MDQIRVKALPFLLSVLSWRAFVTGSRIGKGLLGTEQLWSSLGSCSALSGKTVAKLSMLLGDPWLGLCPSRGRQRVWCIPVRCCGVLLSTQIKEKLLQLTEKRKEMIDKWEDRWEWLRLSKDSLHLSFCVLSSGCFFLM